MKHRWSTPIRTLHRTERTCVHCGLLRVTRHEPGEWPWTEWYEDGKRIFMSSGSPACTGIEQEAEAA